MTNKPSKRKLHAIGVESVARELIEHGISTRINRNPYMDLTLDNGKTITIRSQFGESRLALGENSLPNLRSDYLIIISNLKYTSLKRIYIMTTEDARKIAIDKPRKKTGISDYFIDKSEYAPYKNKYDIITI